MNREAVPDESLSPRLLRVRRDCCTLGQRSSDDPHSAAIPIGRAAWAPQSRTPCDGCYVSTLARELGDMQSIAMRGISPTASTSSADTECPFPIPTTSVKECDTSSTEANDEDHLRTTRGWPNDQWRPTYCSMHPWSSRFSRYPR